MCNTERMSYLASYVEAPPANGDVWRLFFEGDVAVRRGDELVTYFEDACQLVRNMSAEEQVALADHNAREARTLVYRWVYTVTPAKGGLVHVDVYGCVESGL
jgi:hypothetical protein